MFYLVLGVVVLVSIVTMIVVFPFFIQKLAKSNLFFTTVKEGTAKAIMRGKSFERFIMSFAGYHLNDPSKKSTPSYCVEIPDWQVEYHGKENTKGYAEENDARYDERQGWHGEVLKHFGVYWIGWPWSHNIWVYAFEWNETMAGEDGKEVLKIRPEATDFIYVADFTYAIKTDGAETKDRLPTDELTLVTVAVRNPYRALFSGEDWIRRVTSAVNRRVKEYVGGMDFSKLITEDTSKLSAQIVLLSECLPGESKKTDPPRGLKARYGVVIRTADLQTIELSGDIKKENQEQTAKEYAARQEAKTIVLKGEAESEALAKRLAVIKEHGEVGIMLAGFDAIQQASKGPGNTIIWANDPLGAVAGILNIKGQK